MQSTMMFNSAQEVNALYIYTTVHRNRFIFK